ncbi:MAG: hypothetical protein QF473_28740, partial [Planctomycetota bacterium]|nr:hypothetical protein [Planctomycetota bacterium]
EVLDHEDLAYTIVRAFPRVTNMDYRDKRISFEFGGKADDLSELVRELVIKEIPVLWCREVDVNLEEAFMTITKGEVS